MNKLIFIKTIKSIILGAFFLLIISCNKKSDYKNIDPFYVKNEQKYKTDLSNLISNIKEMSSLTSKEALQKQFKKTRLSLKKIEPFLAFYKAAAYKSLNQPNLPTLHEDSNGVVEEQPRGFQVIEEVLFTNTPDYVKIKEEIADMQHLLTLEQKNINTSFFKKHHFLWMIRKALIRVMAHGITGFDSPILKHAIPENKAVFISLKESITDYQNYFQDKKLEKKWKISLDNIIALLGEDKNFNNFNRYHFIKNHLNPLLILWKETVVDWKVTFPFPTKLNNNASSFFSKNTFNINSFKPKESPNANASIIRLGKDLFSDKRLSRSEKISCATCHQKALYFTDGLVKGMDNNNKPLARNTPTILYAGLQANQFYDGRVRSLENQINEVATNKREFHTNLKTIVPKIKKDTAYALQFKTIYKKGVSEKNIKNALASYMRSLNPFNSKFDKNISGIEHNYTNSEINGFNLFMGKAQCATCHYAPIFNGTVPPNFSHSEFEVLGVPKTAVFKNASIDEDLGRYNVYKIKKRKFAFKTPTVRNIAKTAPYMHNGVYKSLEEVVKFYNLGGGHGIGATIKNQTLPVEPLNLTKTEIKDLIAFMRSLTDDIK